MTMLLASSSIYVLPAGEVARGVGKAGVSDPALPSPEEVVKLAEVLKADAVFTGSVKEYGEVRSGASAANVVSVSLQLMEAQTGKVVWSGASTQGGITVWDRLFGGGGQAINKATEQAINDLLNQLFK